MTEDGLNLQEITVVGPNDKVIVHVDTSSRQDHEALNHLADELHRMFDDRSVVLVGSNIHINVVRGSDE